MSRKTLENWVEEIKKSKSSYELENRTGVYDGLKMWFGMTDCQRGKLFQMIDDNELFELWGSEYKPEFYNKYFEKIQRYGLGEDAQFFFRTPDVKTVFPKDSDFSNIGNEKGFEYDTSLQLYFFSGFEKVIKGYEFLVEDFILPNKIPTYVTAGNCKNEKYKKFSNYIND